MTVGNEISLGNWRDKCSFGMCKGNIKKAYQQEKVSSVTEKLYFTTFHSYQVFPSCDRDSISLEKIPKSRLQHSWITAHLLIKEV